MVEPLRTMWRIAVALTVAIAGTFACSGGMNNDYEFLQDPVLTMRLSPPIGWTFFPIKSSDNQVVWFFVGQSNDTLHANQRADAEITAAMLDAFTTVNMPIYEVVIANDYNPVQVENPMALTTGAGPLYGKVEAGALTQTAVAGTAFVWQPYAITVKVTLTNAGATRYNWNIIINSFMQKLTLNFNARFIGGSTVGKV